MQAWDQTAHRTAPLAAAVLEAPARCALVAPARHARLHASVYESSSYGFVTCRARLRWHGAHRVFRADVIM